MPKTKNPKARRKVDDADAEWAYKNIDHQPSKISFGMKLTLALGGLILAIAICALALRSGENTTDSSSSTAAESSAQTSQTSAAQNSSTMEVDAAADFTTDQLTNWLNQKSSGFL
ncbi:MAG: hypothetical protein LBM73_00995, partial [Candidatus Nomurabacteria bacterium]|nr:hypothetical protein [Candidatus Nomurabacteria bacterium]